MKSQRSGQLLAIEVRRRARVGALVAAVFAAVPVTWLYGFTVDDALITARVANHIHDGSGYRFNIGGAVVDAVTPLGWAYFLAPFAGGSPLSLLHFVKAFGAAAWVLAAALLGARVARGSGFARWGALVPLAVCMPIAAWAASGMETGLIIALCTVAVVSEQREARAATVALAVALRPELLPWAVTLVVGRAVAARRSPARCFGAGALASVPAIAVAGIRALVFGSPVPLAVWAKPSDLAHGVFYVLAALLWSGVPVLVAAPFSMRALDGEERAVLVAAAAHGVSLVLVGGDWMPLFRLMTPILPGLILVGAGVAERSPVWATATRVGIAVVISGILLVDKGEATRGVTRQRLALIDRARAALAGARRVATVDAGWVGAAFPGEVVDLAGVTDPAVARLPGDHTSKHLPEHFLRTRGVDALVLLVDGPVPPDWTQSAWGRAVEIRIVNEARDLGFTPDAELELRGSRLRYVVLRLKNLP